MVAAVYRGDYRVAAFRRGYTECDREHDSVAVRHHGGTHGFLRIVAIRNRTAARQRRSCQEASDGGDIHHVVRHHQVRRTTARVLQLFFVALAVVERHQTRECSFGGYFVCKRDGIQSAGTDNDRFHEGSLF